MARNIMSCLCAWLGLLLQLRGPEGFHHLLMRLNVWTLNQVYTCWYRAEDLHTPRNSVSKPAMKQVCLDTATPTGFESVQNACMLSASNQHTLLMSDQLPEAHLVKCLTNCFWLSWQVDDE